MLRDLETGAELQLDNSPSTRGLFLACDETQVLGQFFDKLGKSMGELNDADCDNSLILLSGWTSWDATECS